MTHQHESFVTEWLNGNMNGFNLDTHKGHCRQSGTCAYGYVPKTETQPYLDMASQYAFADRMFESNEGPSFPAHQYIISGTSTTDSTGKYKAADNPYSHHGANGGGCDAPQYVLVDTINQYGPFGNPVYPCFDRQTLGDLLDKKAISWRYYQTGLGVGLWHPFDAISHIRYGQDYANVVTPSSQVLTDISTGKLAQVSWVSPAGSDSDHSGERTKGGPAWVSSIVDGWERANTGTSARFSLCGTTGADGTTTFRRRSTIVRTGLPRAADRDFALREKGVRFGNAIRIRQLAQVCRANVRNRLAQHDRRPREFRRRHVRFQPASAIVHTHQSASLYRRSHRSRLRLTGTQGALPKPKNPTASLLI